ncbi:hypothetical protein BRARA_A00118 [Brassica rapa]|uniref:Uncharacterized protein n=1 Tax=Brassica campestris TaxID=3711 RepID=A0A398ANI1_BRACM|nr:transcription factor MYB87-like isoform X2 [Brassica napus]RID77190.1 hypothetical protein BRARA_A00118 [Brassica rapa]
MGRAPCCDKTVVKKGPWSPEEDAMLKSYIEKHGTGNNWIALPHKIGIKRCGKSCRLRWLNYLRPNLKHGGFTDEEDYIICSLYITIGSRWSIIASQLPGRTDNDIKNYWNTRLKKKLLSKQGKAIHQQLSLRLEPETTSKRSSFGQNQILMFHDENAKPPLNQTIHSKMVDPSITSFAMEEKRMVPVLESYSWEQNKGDQEMFFMAGFENLQDELFDEIINNITTEFEFRGTETLNNNCLGHEINSFVDCPLKDN